MYHPSFRKFLIDASLLIDLCIINRKIISIFASFEDGIYVVRDVLEEVRQITEKEAVYRGIRIVVFMALSELLHHLSLD